MRALIALATAFSLVAMIFAAAPAVADDDTRIVVYCDPGSCPGVSAGDREDSCEYLYEGYFGTCFYASGGYGVGVLIGPGWQHGFCFDIKYCIGASLEDNPRCGTGKMVRVFSHYGQINTAQCLLIGSEMLFHD